MRQTKIQIVRTIATLTEDLKGTTIAEEAEQIMKKRFSQVTLEQLTDLKNRMNKELKMQFIQKGFQ